MRRWTRRTDGSDYACFRIDPGLTETKLIGAITPVLDNQRIVHHMLLFRGPPNGNENCYGEEMLSDMLAGWAPGQEGWFLPDGVAYELEVTSSVLGRLPRADEPIALYTHMVVREDAQLLYGFGSRDERDLFRALIRINGVGPKLGLSLISAVSLAQLAQCVRDNDATALTRVPGVGRKTAERITLELIDKLDDLADGEVPAPAGAAAAAMQALRGLGYGQIESERAVRRAQEGTDGEEVGTEELVRRALQHV